MMTEHDIQRHVVLWAKLNAKTYPALALLYAVPNGGHRSKRTAIAMKREGVRAGVPDLCLPVAGRDGTHALYIEMKTPKGRVRPNQQQWIDNLRSAGNSVQVCRSFEEATACLLNHIGASSGNGVRYG